MMGAVPAPHPATRTAGPTAGDWLAIGGLHHVNGTATVAEDDPWVLAPLPCLRAAGDPGRADNTVLLRWADLGHLDLHATSRAGGTQRRAGTTGAELFDRFLPGAALRALAGTDRRAAAAPVPLFVLRTGPADGSGRLEAHVYGQIRFLPEDALFIRLTPQAVPVGAVTDLDWVPAALRHHAEHSLFLSNHQRYYRRCFPGRELEYKYTARPSTADIWTLNALVYQRIAEGLLPGYLLEYRDEFQAWDYTNHLYDVVEPESERGYVSFIPTTDGKNLLKRKWFSADAFDRRESHTYGVVAPDGFETYIRDELELVAVRLPPFRRTRYDVNFESVRSGHVYGIFFDTVSLLDSPEIQLQQCELEYLRSRTAIEPDEELVTREITEIAVWLERFLAEHGYPAERGYYSKLSFLRHAVAAHPELLQAVS